MNNLISNCRISVLFFFLLGIIQGNAQSFYLTGQASSFKNRAQLDKKFTQYQTFSLDALALSQYLREGRTPKNVHVQLGEHKWDLVIRPNDIRTPQYQLVLGTDQGNKSYPADANVTYTARFENEATINSALTIDDDFINGYVHEGQNYWFIEPARLFQPDAPHDAYVFYNLHDVKPFENKCAVDHLGGIDKVQNTQNELHPELTPLACKQGVVAIAIDNDLYVAQGASNETVKNIVFSVINNVNTLYASAFTDQIKFTITRVFVATTSGSDPYSPATSSTEASVLLNNFTSWGQGGNFGIASSVFDFGMVFTSRDIASSGNTSTVGLAWVGGSCGSSLYQVDEYANSPIAGMAAVTAHETGHNLSATHDASSGFIMSASVNFSVPPTTWSSASVTSINNFYPTKTCIAACTTLGAPTADFIAPTKIGCTNTSVSFTDLSTNDPNSWAWSFSSGSPSSSGIQNPSAQWASQGTYTVSLTSSNSAGSSSNVTKSNYVTIIAPPTNPCSPSGSNLDTKGITKFSLSGINYSSGNSTADNANYLNLACTQSTSLTVNTSYTVQMELPTFAAIRVWIDYNDNNSFSDANELIHTNGDGFLNSGNYSFTFTTPASPSTGKLLRLRARAYSNAFNNDPCATYASATGQTEDYAVYFGTIAVLPVELTQFKGLWQNDFAALNWQTASENQNRGFEIERSLDGLAFEKIGFVTAQGGNRADYWFNDYGFQKVAPPQYIYYRLKQLDDDGGFRYSKIILVATNGKAQWAVSPNPSKGLFNLNTSQPFKDDVDIEVLDLLGRTVFSQRKTVDAGNPITLDLSSIASGVYVLKVSQPQQALFVSKLVKD
jgi:PKD repeat protein